MMNAEKIISSTTPPRYVRGMRQPLNPNQPSSVSSPSLVRRAAAVES